MNYYERHIGDYLKDTSHLSLLEHGVYTRLLDVYYTRECGIPADQAARLIGARSKDELAALRAVLEEFFVLSDGAYAQPRAEREIARYQDKQSKAKRSAEARWNKHESHTEGNANALPDAMRTHTEGNAPRARPQSPVTSNQTPEDLSDLVATASDPKPKTPRKTRLPDHATLSTDESAAALDYWRRHGRIDLVPDTEYEKFVAHHRSRGSSMADWSCAWKTWYCNAVKFNQPNRIPVSTVGAKTIEQSRDEISERAKRIAASINANRTHEGDAA